MNKLILLCSVASAVAVIIILIARTDTSETVTLRASEWECRDTVPVGLHGECTNLVRKIKQQARG